MKLPIDPWNNRWSSFYGIAWNFTMEFRGKCPNPTWKILMEKFPWNSMGNVLILHANTFHGNPWRIFHGIPWRFFTRDFGFSERPIVRRSQIHFHIIATRVPDFGVVDQGSICGWTNT